MAFSKKPASLDQLLKNYIRRMPRQDAFKRGMVLHVWPEVVGERVAEATESLSFDDENRLLVRVRSDAWRNELHMNRFSICKKLNGKVGSRTVKEVIVRC